MSKKQSKKQSDSSIPEQAASLLLFALEHPEETKVAVKAINTLGLVTYALTTAAIDYLTAPKAAAAAPEPQVLPSYADEQHEAFTDEQEAFTPAPFWPLMEDQPVGFDNRFFPVYESPYGRRHRGVGMFW
jgi:hypothetical protein